MLMSGFREVSVQFAAVEVFQKRAVSRRCVSAELPAFFQPIQPGRHASLPSEAIASHFQLQCLLAGCLSYVNAAPMPCLLVVLSLHEPGPIPQQVRQKNPRVFEETPGNMRMPVRLSFPCPQSIPRMVPGVVF